MGSGESSLCDKRKSFLVVLKLQMLDVIENIFSDAD